MHNRYALGRKSKCALGYSCCIRVSCMMCLTKQFWQRRLPLDLLCSLFEARVLSLLVPRVLVGAHTSANPTTGIEFVPVNEHTHKAMRGLAVSFCADIFDPFRIHECSIVRRELV